LERTRKKKLDLEGAIKSKRKAGGRQKGNGGNVHGERKEWATDPSCGKVRKKKKTSSVGAGG